MDSIGTEVGQKMRSAIKAKLMELGCYVDDELPDYIMVMVANKRSRIQMEEDLQLFLRSNTKVFVDWLQQVLNKLKEVTITNPGMYACSSFKELKRKASLEIAECLIKKEKKDKKHKTEKKARVVEPPQPESPKIKSISDEIPVSATTLVEKRNQSNRLLLNLDKASELNKEKVNTSNEIINRNDFDILSLAEVSERHKLVRVEEMEKDGPNRIVLMRSDSEDEDFINIRADAEELLTNELNEVSNPPSSVSEEPANKPTTRIIKLKRTTNDSSRDNEKEQLKSAQNNSTIKPSLADRLGSQIKTNTEAKKPIPNEKRRKINLTETLREEEEFSGKFRRNYVTERKVDTNKGIKKESVHKRLGVPSAVISLAKKVELSSAAEAQPKSVPSVVQVKPRRVFSGPCQANKNLLLKAVAEAQKSVTQAATRSNKNKEALYTKNYKEKLDSIANQKSLPTKSKPGPENGPKVQNIIIEVKSKNSMTNVEVFDELSPECASPNLTKDEESNADDNDYIPSTIDLNYDDLDKYIEDVDLDEQTKPLDENLTENEIETNHQFIVTLDGINKNDIPKEKDDVSSTSTEEPPKVVKKCPSPIIFDKNDELKPAKNTLNVPDRLPKVHLPVPVKTKERCKYWPGCWLREACEFIHPQSPCKAFPLCKYGDQCLYIHPKCKFDSSCTRKDCPYSHKSAKPPPKIVSRSASYSGTPLEICKYYPGCSNLHCQYYHPKVCRFGKYCMNKAECNFAHGKIPTKEKLTWHSNIR